MRRRKILLIILVLVFVSTGSLYVVYHRETTSSNRELPTWRQPASYSADSPDDKLTANSSFWLLNRALIRSRSNGKLRLLIVASMRTGSSFLGQLFNQNRQFLYFFEPFLSFHDQGIKDDTWKMQTQIMEFLKNVFRCNFAPLQHYLSWLNRQTMALRIRNVPKFYAENCVYRNREPISCSKLSVPGCQKTCNSLPHMAIKTIRLRYIDHVLNLARNQNRNSGSENLKILILVRDPRGKFASEIPLVLSNFGNMGYKEPTRMFIKSDLTTTMAEKTKLYCSSMYSNGYLAKKNNLTVGVVRFEDLASDPMKFARKIYDFLGLRLPKSVTGWIRDNTNIGHLPFDPYSTQRNSSAVVGAWRNHLSYDLVEVIQDYCENFMLQFGYRTFSSQEDLTNKEVSSLIP